MSVESKCNCQHCNGHVSFPSEMAGQTTNCPHCQLETLLFIPPVGGPPKQSAPKSKATNPVVLAVVAFALIALVAIGAVLKQASKQTKQTLPSNLKPVGGAFGWKLGDSLPANLRTQVRDGKYRFTPETQMTPLDDFELELTEDGRIFRITAKGYAPDQGADSYTCERSIVSILTEKYGLRSHDLAGDFNTYRFGNDDQMASLQIYKYDSFELSYVDRKLYSVYSDELEAKRKRDEDEKKSALSKGL